MQRCLIGRLGKCSALRLEASAHVCVDHLLVSALAGAFGDSYIKVLNLPTGGIYSTCTKVRIGEPASHGLEKCIILPRTAAPGEPTRGVHGLHAPVDSTVT